MERRIVQGTAIMGAALLKATQGGGPINTAYSGHRPPCGRTPQRSISAAFNVRGAADSRLSPPPGNPPDRDVLARGCLQFLPYPDSLTQSLAGHGKPYRTPAMAASLTDHRWPVDELLSYKAFKPPSKTVLNLPRKLQK